MAGLLLALVGIYIRPLQSVLLPALAAFNGIPKIAIAPLFVIWFGLGSEPKILLAFLMGRVVSPSAGGGMEDLAAVAVTFLGGEILVGLGCVIASMVLFRRGRRYTGVGLMGGWIVGLALVIAVQAIL